MKKARRRPTSRAIWRASETRAADHLRRRELLASCTRAGVVLDFTDAPLSHRLALRWILGESMVQLARAQQWSVDAVAREIARVEALAARALAAAELGREERSRLVNTIALAHDTAMRLRLYGTGRQLHGVLQKVGWEIAAQLQRRRQQALREG